MLLLDFFVDETVANRNVYKKSTLQEYFHVLHFNTITLNILFLYPINYFELFFSSLKLMSCSNCISYIVIFLNFVL